jgi:hypothetical protein
MPEPVDKQCAGISLQPLCDCRLHAARAGLLAATAAAPNTSDIQASITPLRRKDFSRNDVVNRPQRSKLSRALGFLICTDMDVETGSP